MATPSIVSPTIIRILAAHGTCSTNTFPDGRGLTTSWYTIAVLPGRKVSLDLFNDFIVAVVVTTDELHAAIVPAAGVNIGFLDVAGGTISIAVGAITAIVVVVRHRQGRRHTKAKTIIISSSKNTKLESWKRNGKEDGESRRVEWIKTLDGSRANRQPDARGEKEDGVV